MGSNVVRTVSLILAALLSACAGGGASGEGPPGSRVAPRSWASRVCSATAAWTDEIHTLNAGLREHLDATSLEALRHSTVAYFDELLASTDRMIDHVEAAGVPDVAGGERAAENVLTGLSTARAALGDARDRAAALTTDDADAFGEALREIGNDVATSLSEVAGSMARFRSPQLDAASKDVSACRELASA